MTAQESQYTDGAWYWVEKEGWIGDPPTIEPAKYKANCDAWYSFEFSGVPTREVKVLEPCTRAQPVASTPLSDTEQPEFGTQSKAEYAIEIRKLKRRIAELEASQAQRAPLGWVAMTKASPAGWRLAPEKASNEMAKAGAQAAREYLERTGGNSPWAIYEAMLAAAPQPPEATVNDCLTVESAPVQLPDPIGVLHVFEPTEGAGFTRTKSAINASHLPCGWYLLYTEQQVRKLLESR